MLDLIDGYRYRDYLETRRLASFTAAICNSSGNLKRAISADDLAGHWVNGRILDKAEYWESQKALAKKRKHDRLKREGVE